MSLRPRSAAKASNLIAGVVPAATGITAIGNQRSRTLTESAEVDASWWQRRERVRQQPLPRLQLYAFDTTQANDELYTFLYDRKEVRHFYSQSRNDGERMGELEAVEGYGRADIMAMAWTRKGGADFELVFYGHMNKNLAEGYVIRTDVNGSLTWVVKLTRLYGEHIMALTSRTLFSLPVYTALATGLKFGLEDFKANDYLGFNVGESTPIPTPAANAPAEAAVEAGMANMDISDTTLPPAAVQPGRCETGSFFSTQQTLDVKSGEPELRGDKWTIVRPWDNNHSISGVASFERYNPYNSLSGNGIRCLPQVKDSPVGVVFPTRGTPVAGMGKLIHRIDVEAVPISGVLGVKAAHAMSAYRAYLYNDDVGAKEALFGTIDVVPDARRSPDGKSMTASRFKATPSVGKTWVGEADEPIVVDTTDVQRCKEGDVCPWSLDLVCVLESAIHKLESGMAA